MYLTNETVAQSEQWSAQTQHEQDKQGDNKGTSSREHQGRKGREQQGERRGWEKGN